MVAYAAQGQTPWPGDVLGSGTAAGSSGLELDRQSREGDIVELEIDGIGVLGSASPTKGASTWHT